MLVAVIILSAVLLVIFLVWAIRHSFGKDYIGNPYSSGEKNLKLKEQYLNSDQFYFYSFVNKHLKEEYYIVPKVGVDNLLEPLNNNLNQYNSTKSKYVDFLICDAKTQKPLLVIDLVQHGVGSQNPYFDKDVLSALSMVEIPIMTKTVDRYYVWDVLEQEIEKHILKKVAEEKKDIKPQETENK